MGKNDGLEYAAASALEKTNKTLAVAESLTGGLVTHRLTNVPGISRFLLEGVVTYSNAAKVRLLGCKEDDLMRSGAVSAVIAEQMARGARERSGADIAISTTGIAGPSGGTAEKPVGLVFVGVSSDAGTRSRELRLEGGRLEIKSAAAEEVLRLLIEELG